MKLFCYIVVLCLEGIMHNLISYNQLAEWTQENSKEQEELVNDYFNCLIECDDNQVVCKRICKEILV